MEGQLIDAESVQVQSGIRPVPSTASAQPAMTRLSAASVLVAAAVVPSTLWSTTGVEPPPSTTVAASTADASSPALNADNDHLFTVGDIRIPSGEAGQLSVVAAGRVDDTGHLPIVVRNNREQTVFDIGVVMVGTDASGAEVAAAEYLISTAGVAPGEWTFGQNGVAAPNLTAATNFQLEFSATVETVFVELDVIAAEIQGDAIVGTVVNNAKVVVGDFNPVNVACFDGPRVTSYEMAMAEPLGHRLLPGGAAHFATTIPIDPTVCTAFAVYAVGLPAT